MRLLPTLAALAFMGCQQYDTPEMARMSARELNSYRALNRYFGCMAPRIKIAKAGPRLSDSQVNNLGYQCMPELQEAARTRELYFAAKANDLPNELSAPTRAERVKLHEKDLASSFWCDFRECPRTD